MFCPLIKGECRDDCGLLYNKRGDTKCSIMVISEFFDQAEDCFKSDGNYVNFMVSDENK